MQGGLAIYNPDEQITYVNDRFCELLGYTRTELTGARSYDFVDPVEIQKLDAQVARRRLAESSSYEIIVRRKDGQPRNLLVAGSPLLDKNGVYIGSVAVTTDITPQKQAEATLRQALSKEKELGELKSRFISMASHEFRTPLATILALTETIIAYRTRLSETQVDQRLHKICEQVAHLKSIMEDVLLLAQMQARRGEFTPTMVDLDLLCRTIVDEFESQPEIGHRLLYSCHNHQPAVRLDGKLLRRIISNLLTNGIKYSPVDKNISLTLEFTAAAVILQVCDEGIGIPKADQSHLFEPFHRATNVGTISGTGLGLVITKEAVALHNGTIEVESRVGVGTTFTVTLPINPEPST
jgi:PAS domain S-box-containing protein